MPEYSQDAHDFVPTLWLCYSRREVYSAPTLGGLSSDSDREHEEEEEDGAENDNPEDIAANSSSDSSHGEEDTGTDYEVKENTNTVLTLIQVTACCPFRCHRLC